MESATSPVATLANAILLSADKKQASQIWIRREGVSFQRDGEWHPEMELPPALHGPLVRRLGIMGSLPSYGKDEYAQGTIVLMVGETRTLTFDVRVRGHGEALEALLRSVPETT